MKDQPDGIRLTIAIPTYNRAPNVLCTLEQLFSQPGIDRCEIVVVDNASEQPVEAYIASSAPHIAGKVRFHRNVGNLGLSGNILRCFELGSTEWLWILADDDVIQPSAVEAILGRLENASSLDFILFGQGPGQSGGTEAASSEEFAFQLDTWSRITFISAGLYRTSRAQALLNVGINYAYSVVPFLAMILQGLEQHRWRVAFESFVLVEPAHRASNTWSPVWSIHTYLVAELVESPRAARRLLSLAKRWALGPVGLVHDLQVRTCNQHPGLSRLAVSHKLAILGWGGMRRRLLVLLCRLVILLPPRLGMKLIEALRKIAGRSGRNGRSGERIFGQA